MSIVAHVGSTLNSTVTLTVEAGTYANLESMNSEEWLAPAKVQLVDSGGVVWYEGLIDNPQPRIIGSEYLFDYELDFVIPEVAPSDYRLLVRRWTVTSSESITIEGLASDVNGAEDVLALVNDTDVKWALVDENSQATVNWSLDFVRITNDHAHVEGDTDRYVEGLSTVFVSKGFSPSLEGLKASLNPHTIIWNITDSPGRVRRQTSALYIINLNQLNAVTEFKAFFDRLHEEKRLPSLEYSLADYCRWMKRGADMFNAGGLFTDINMSNATGAIRHWWFICSIISALQNMYMLEGQRSFSFSGQSVTLDVDITNYLQSLMDGLKGDWDSEKLSFKQQLKQYGLTSGDGNMAYAKFQAGTVGLSLGPASNFGGFYGARNILGGIRFF